MGVKNIFGKAIFATGKTLFCWKLFFLKSRLFPL